MSSDGTKVVVRRNSQELGQRGSSDDSLPGLLRCRYRAADAGDTVRTILFGHGWPNAPHRTLRTAFVQQWLGQEGRGQESRPDEPVVGQTVIGGQHMPVLRFMGFPPNSDASGDIDSMDLLAGQGVGLVRELKPAAQIVRELVEEARQIISQRLAGLVATRASQG